MRFTIRDLLWLTVVACIIAVSRGVAATDDHDKAAIERISAAARRKAGQPQFLVEGSRLFKSSGCAHCHRDNSSRPSLGPRLSQLRTMRHAHDVAAAIVEPSATIAPRYQVYEITDINGHSVRGIRKDTAHEIEISDSRNVWRLPRSQVEGITATTSSLMPSEALASEDDLSTIVAFLISDDSVSPKRWVTQGKPSCANRYRLFKMRYVRPRRR